MHRGLPSALDGHLPCSQVSAVTEPLLWASVHRVLCGHRFSFFRDKRLGVQLLGHAMSAYMRSLNDSQTGSAVDACALLTCSQSGRRNLKNNHLHLWKRSWQTTSAATSTQANALQRGEDSKSAVVRDSPPASQHREAEPTPRGCGWAVSSLPGGFSPPAEGESQVSTAEMWGPSCSAPRGMETAPRQDALSTGARSLRRLGE